MVIDGGDHALHVPEIEKLIFSKLKKQPEAPNLTPRHSLAVAASRFCEAESRLVPPLFYLSTLPTRLAEVAVESLDDEWLESSNDGILLSNSMRHSDRVHCTCLIRE